MRSGSAGGKKKITLYFGAEMLDETQREALRQDRSISWIIQAAWRHAREDLKRLPGVVAPVHAPLPQPALAPPLLNPPPRARVTPSRGRRAVV